jgi:cytochrome c oxidase subunit I+III
MSVEEEEAFEREYQVPVNAGGSVMVATWGLGIMILFIAIAFASLLLSYFYLRLENQLWPPAGIAEPGLLLVTVAAALMVVSGGTMRAALRRVAHGDQRGFVRTLGGTLVVAGSAAVVQLLDMTGVGFGWTAHAYGSIFYTLAGFVFLIALCGAIMVAMTLFWALRGLYTARRHAAVANVVRFYTAMVAVWVIGFATIYLGPYLM